MKRDGFGPRHAARNSLAALVAAVFLFSGYGKLFSRPYDLFATFNTIGMPAHLHGIVLHVLIVVELLLGVLLIRRHNSRGVLLLGLGLLAAFSIVLLFLQFVGADHGCGCVPFATFTANGHWWALARNGTLILILVGLVATLPSAS